MTIVILIVIISIITGFLLTYFLSARYSIFERTAYGVVVGLGLYTWIVYLFSLLLGLSGKSIYISIGLLVLFCSVVLTIKWGHIKEKILSETREIKDDFFLNKVSYFVHIAVFSFFTTIFWRLFYRTIIWKEDGLYIGLPNNYGDLPLHLAYITSFVWGNNIPPQDPAFAGVKLTYPILSDFLSAIFLKLGLDFRDILFLPGLLLTVALYSVLYYFTYRLTKRRLAAIVAPFIFFFTGGFGFYYFFHDLANTSGSLWSFLMHIPRDFTKIEPLNYHWITPLTCLNVPQRPFLFGFPITMLVFSLLYTGIEYKSWREFLFAGVLAGALPFFHSHSFLAMLMVTIPLGLIFWDWRKWFLFFMPAFILSLPQVIYLSNHAGGFLKLHFGWVAGGENILWFWLKNTSLFWPLIIGGFVALFVLKKDIVYSSCFPNHNTQLATYNPQHIVGLFSLSFIILFIVPNLVLLAPWDWDNIKILIYWFLGTTPVAALALTLLYGNKRYKILSKVGFFIIMFVLTFAGWIDVFKYAIAPIPGWKEYSSEEIELARRISSETPSNAIFLNAPIFNHIVFLTGRKSLMGWPPHIWSHGYSGGQERENDVKKMLKGKPEANLLIDKYKPDYVVVGPQERQIGVNKRFYDANYSCIITTKYYNVYDLSKKNQSQPIGKNKNLIDKKYGLNVYYYNNLNWVGEPVYEEINTDIEFNYSSDNEKPVSSPFSVLVEGYIDTDISGTYTFILTSDDGSWLYIDDILVIYNGGYHAAKPVAGSIVLEGGQRKIMVKYFDGGGGAVLNLLWVPPDGVESAIPMERLKEKE